VEKFVLLDMKRCADWQSAKKRADRLRYNGIQRDSILG
jgi:hypothetical protein